MSDSLPFGLSHVDDALAESLRVGLDAVEVALRKAVTSDYPFVTETSSHLVNAGGKRFRPLLALVAAEYGDTLAAGNVPGAVVAELTHLATLYHDDVMDEAPLRRGEKMTIHVDLSDRAVAEETGSPEVPQQSKSDTEAEPMSWLKRF